MRHGFSVGADPGDYRPAVPGQATGQLGVCRRIPSSARERAFFCLAKTAKQAILASSSMQPDAARRKISRSKPDRVFRQSLTLLLVHPSCPFIPSYRHEYNSISEKFGKIKRIPVIFRPLCEATQEARRGFLVLLLDQFGFLPLFLGTSGTFFSGSHLANSFLTAAYLGSFARLVHSRASFSWS